jgi:hypothetical protein
MSSSSALNGVGSPGSGWRLQGRPVPRQAAGRSLPCLRVPRRRLGGGAHCRVGGHQLDGSSGQQEGGSAQPERARRGHDHRSRARDARRASRRRNSSWSATPRTSATARMTARRRGRRRATCGSSTRRPPMSYAGTWATSTRTRLENLHRSIPLGADGAGPASPPLQPLWQKPMNTIFGGGAWQTA